MKNIQGKILLFLISFLSLNISAQTDTIPQLDDYEYDYELEEFVVRSKGRQKSVIDAGNTELITTAELSRAACCNLGESFSTNPSVDVNYSDAATGSKQIRLLGLSGSYVQMLTENVPNLRGVSSAYALDFIPGAWIQSIQVSKGTSSVKNGFESVTGQINVEMMKPQVPTSFKLNAYFDSDGKLELNGIGNLHFGDKWSGGILLHGANSFWTHDGNDDGFIDMPKIRRISLTNRWAYMGENYVFQISAKGLLEKRKSGQIGGHHSSHLSNPYVIDIMSKRLELFTKNAYIIDKENDVNVALILSGSVDDLATKFGLKSYDALQYEGYASLMFERKWNEYHALSTGLSLQYDDYRQHYLIDPASKEPTPDYNHETVGGLYGQYTFNYDEKIIMMGGLRFDYSSLYGSFVTPRVHVRYNPSDSWSIHASAGTGRRSPHPMAEFHNYLASSRNIILPEKLRMEVGVNTGAGATWNPQIDELGLSVSAEYYFTKFFHQLSADINSPHEVVISADTKGYSNNIQAEVSLTPIEDLTLTAAYRFTDVRVDYGRGYQLKPLTSKSRGLITAGYAPFMGKWQFDATLSITGGGKMPEPYLTAANELSWPETYPTYCRLNLQITRNFRKWSIYVGGENLTNYRQKNPIIDASDPWGRDFDATMIWGPVSGAMGYIGVRVNL